jgi:predicted nucleic acid-binding protein
MIAIDTNVVLRYALRDDPAQAILATDFLRENRCLLLPTVLLEAAWVNIERAVRPQMNANERK